MQIHFEEHDINHNMNSICDVAQMLVGLSLLLAKCCSTRFLMLFGVLFVGRCHSHLPKTLFLVIPRQDLHLETLGYDERSWNSMKLGPGHCTDGDWGA